MLLSAPELALAVAMMLAGSVVSGLVGFGMGMVTSPVLLLVLEPQALVLAINTLSVLSLVMVAVQARRNIPIAEVWPLALAGLAAVPIGVFILDSMDPRGLRMAVAAVILSLAVPTTFKISRPIPKVRVVGPVVAFIASMLTTGLGVGIPLMALYLLNRGWSAYSIRVSTAMYYLIFAMGALVLYGVTGLFTVGRVILIAILFPTVPAGFWLSSLWAKRLDDRLLRYAVLAMVIGPSIALLVKEALAS